MLPSKNELLKQIHNRGHKEVVHLSYKRSEVKPDNKKWEFYKIMLEIRKLVNLFLENTNPKMIDPKMYELR